ncbi:MAG: ribosome-associated toxin RatA of RatAB toxin-antitoxin module [Moritella sp.]|jgi:ribosome-associated toxin RatA of RatAB toxin-antitoxin module
MPRITRSALLMYSAEQMFDLVNDVDTYPEFLPGCTGSRILDTQDDQMTAAVDVSKAGISKTFTTKNTLIAAQEVKMDLVDGPFKKLTGGWTFKELGSTACKVSLDLEFVFSSKLAEVAFGRIFSDLVNNMVQSFTDRAKEVYGVNEN